MRRTARHITLLALAVTLLVPASAFAIPGSTSVTGPSGGTVGSGGGGGRVFMNDVLGINHNYRLEFRRDWHDDVFDQRSCTGRVCRTATAVWNPPSLNGSVGGADRGDSFNRQAGHTVGWWNRCNVSSNILSSSDSSSGCGSNNPGSVPGANSWGEIHTDAPLRSPLSNPIGPYARTNAPLMGAPTFVSVRIWRECRIDSPGYVTSGSAGVNADVNASRTRCEVDPIFERTIPYTDSTTTNQTYFWSRRTADDQNEASSNWQYSAFAAIGNRSSAGPLFRDCTSDARSGSYRERCNGQGEYVGGSGSSYNDRCESGGMRGTVAWSRNEAMAELAYLTNPRYNRDARSRRYYRDRADRISDWAEGSRAGFPSDTSRAWMCRDFSEWVYMDWSVPGHDNRSNTKLNIKFNAVPGRLYGVQTVITDARENIVQQSFQFLTGRAQVTPAGGCEPGDPACDDAPPATPVPAASPPPPANMSTNFPQSAISGSRVTATVNVQPSVPPAAEEDGLAEDIAKRHSLWLPRALNYSVFNNNDDRGSSTDAANRYAMNHQGAQIQGGGDNFELNGGRPGFRGAYYSGSGDDANAQHDQLGGTGRFLNAFAPLLATESIFSRSSFAMATQNPTRVPDPQYVPNTLFPNYNAKARADEIRNATVLGEGRYVRFGNVNAGTNYRWERLTMDNCPSGERHPELPGGGCNPEASLGQGWKVSDAYRVPPLTDGYVALEAVFSQDEDAEARIQLDTHGDAGLVSRIAQIEVWDRDRFLNRQPGQEPDYKVEYPRSASGEGEIRFCRSTLPPYTETRTRLVNRTRTVPRTRQQQLGVDHYLNTWTPHFSGLAAAPVQQNVALYTEAYYGGAPGIAADIRFYKAANGAIRRHSLGYPPPSWTSVHGPPVTSEVYGREWWGNFTPHPVTGDRDMGPQWITYTEHYTEEETYQEEETYTVTITPPNPECLENPNKNAIDPEGIMSTTGLDAGQYVVRYIIAPGPAFRWGIRARLRTNDTAQWTTAFDLQNSQNFLQVFRTRTAG